MSELQRAGIDDSLVNTIVNFVNDTQEMRGRREEQKRSEGKKKCGVAGRKRSEEDGEIGKKKKGKKKCGVAGCTSLVHTHDGDKSSCYRHMNAKYKPKQCGVAGCNSRVHSDDKDKLWCYSHMKKNTN